MAGARNNKEDKRRLAAIKAAALNIHQHASDMEPGAEPGPTDDGESGGESMKTTKAANLQDWLVAMLAECVTDCATDMLGDGYISQAEQMALFDALKPTLAAFNAALDGALPDFRTRPPYEEMEDDEGSMMKALDDLHCVKALGSNRVGGYMALWGDHKARDLEGEWFTPQTKEMTSIFKAMGRLPYLYNHATDKTMQTEVIGHIDVLQPDDTGLWYEAQLNTANKYLNSIRKLVAAKALGTSSGTLPGARQVSKSGEILRWPVVEGSATPSPCDPRQLTDRPVTELKSLYKSIGLEFPESTEGKGGEEPRQTDVTAKLKLLDLLEVESGVYPL